MGVLHSGIRPGNVALHDKALLAGSLMFCRAEVSECCPGAGQIHTERALSVARKWPWALPELKVATDPQSWSGEHLEAPGFTRVTAAIRRDSQI